MGLLLATVVTILIVILFFYLLGRKYPMARRGAAGDLRAQRVDKVSAARAERENPGLVQDDIRQMLEAQNELRRRRGAPEVSRADLRDAVAEDERNRLRGRGPFSQE